MKPDKIFIDPKKQRAIVIITLLLVAIILIIGHYYFRITQDASCKETQMVLQQAYHTQQILISLIILIIISGAFYALFISNKINEILAKEVESQTQDLKKIHYKLESIKNIGIMANSSLKLNKVLNDILTGTLEITNASVGMIFLKDPNTNYLYLGASIGLSDAFANDFKNSYLEVGEGLSGRIALSGEAIYIGENASRDPRIARAVLRTEDLNSFIGVPIYAKDEIVGVMNISTRLPQILNKDEIHIISAIGSHIGSAIQNAKLYEEREALLRNISKGKKEWETTFDSAIEFIVLVDKEFNILRCNKTFIKHINRPVEKILGNKFYNIFTYDKKNIDLQDYLDKNEIIEEVEVKAKSDGWFYLSKKPVLDSNEKFLFAIIVARDITILKNTQQSLLNSETELKKRIDAFEDLFIKLITVLVSALEAKSLWTKGHSENVANYAEELAKNLGLDENETKNIKLAGLLHDIGKIAIPDNLLDKNGGLTIDERETFNDHPLKGTKILEAIKQLEGVIPLIRSHHERIDGLGYPEGLKDGEIPIGGKILHLVDSFDAMTSNRPYRKNPGIDYAMSEIKKNSGTQFDTKIVDVFLNILSKKKSK